MEEDILQDCRSCKYGWMDDHWKVPTCHCPARCNKWERWEPKMEYVVGIIFPYGKTMTLHEYQKMWSTE